MEPRETQEGERFAAAANAPLASLLFLLAGVSLPLFDFPPLRLGYRFVDVATICSALFLFARLPPLVRSVRRERPIALFLAAAAGIPLLRLVPPWPAWFRPADFVSSYLHWLFLAAVFAAAATLAYDHLSVKRLLAAQTIAGSLIAIFALYQLVGVPRGWAATGTTLVSFQREPLRLSGLLDGYVRPTSLFLEPAWLGGYLAWVAGVGVAIATRATRQRNRVFAGCAVVLCLFALASTISWGAYADAAAVLAGLVWALSWRRVSWAGIAALGGAALLGLLLFLVLTPPGRRVLHAASTRMAALRDTPVGAETMGLDVSDSSWVRNRNLQHTIRLWRAHPARGIGLGQYAAFQNDGPPGSPRFRDPWSGWVTSAAEMGIAGPFLLLAPFCLVGWRLWSRRPVGVAGIAVLPLLAFAACAQIHTASYIDLWYWYPLSLAMICASARPGVAA